MLEDRDMPSQTIAKKVEALESRVSTLEELPGRLTAVGSQLVQLRREMRDGFSAASRQLQELRDEARQEIVAVREDLRAGDEETRRYMRVLHEDVIGRIALLQEGLGPKRSRKPKNG